MRTFVLTALLGFTVWVGCEQVVDIELPPHESLLVVNSYFTPDSTWDIRLSRSVSYTDTLFGRAPWVENGTVAIWQGDRQVEVLQNLGGGRYRGTTRPAPEGTYTVRAASPDLEPVDGHSQVPDGALIELNNIRVIEVDEEQQSFRGNEILLTVSIQKRTEEKEYFNLRVIGISEAIEPEFQYNDDSTYVSFSSIDFALSEDGIEEYYQDRAYFDDALFDGGTYDLDIAIPYSSGFRVEGEKRRYYIQFLTLSEDLYFYEVSADRQRSTDQDPFTEPVDVYSNISSGFGIFAGYHAQVVRVPVDITL